MNNKLLTFFAYTGLLFSLALLYFTLINRMYAWTIYYLVAIVLISLYNMFILGLSFLTDDKKATHIATLSFILNIIPLVYYIWVVFFQNSAIL